MIAELRRKKSPLGDSLQKYRQQSRGPLASLVLVLPLLVLYEIGVLVLGSAAVRNGAEVWLRGLLDWIGLGNYLLLPVLTVGILLAWHHTTRQPWKVRMSVIAGMAIESAVLAMVLVVIAHIEGALLYQIGYSEPLETTLSLGNRAINMIGRLVGFFGAGIYEEVMFRLLLLPVVAGLISLAGGSAKWRAWGAVLVTSLLFSAAHYVGPAGDPLELYSFVFRFLAGAFFAMLFVYRGFGIAVGTHALYDIYVGLNLSG